jgi:hypothetical protein
MAIAAGVFGSSFEAQLNITAARTIAASEAYLNLVVAVSGMPDTLTLPAISAMVASQNLSIQINNKSTSGGTLTIACNAADSIVGRTTLTAGTATIFRHNGLNQWFPTT